MIAPFPGYFSDDAEKRILFGLQASPVDSFRHNAFCENFLPRAAISEKKFAAPRNDVTPIPSFPQAAAAPELFVIEYFSLKQTSNHGKK
jgi:hypothetical protein